MKPTSRRDFLHGLGVTAAGAAALATLGVSPRLARADVARSDLKFIFFFNSGGWDPLTVFAPMFDRDGIDMGEGDEPFDIGGLQLVHSVERPNVRAFFEEHHRRTAVLNGIAVRSMSHDVCRSVCLTGSSSGRQPEWPVLLDSARASGLQDLREGASAIEALTSGAARCATISPDVSWDTHTDEVDQSALFEGLFADLQRLMLVLADTPGEHASRLVDETVVVVMSEMGRTPRINVDGGRDHWPYTSAMLVGPGIAGSHTFGGFDDRYHGLPIEPGSGEPDGGGMPLSAGVLGATLLALAGADAAALLPGEEPIHALLRGVSGA